MANVSYDLKALKAKLTKCGVRQARVSSFPPVPGKKLESLERKYKAKLPDVVRDYYTAANGHMISWDLPGTNIHGYSLVVDVNAFLSGRVTGTAHGAETTSCPFYSSTLSDEQKAALDRDYWVFERVYADSFVLIPKAQTAADPALVLLEYPFKLTKLRLSFTEYLRVLHESCALLDWQEAHKESEQDRELVECAKADEATLARGSDRSAKPPGVHRERFDAIVKRLKANKTLQVAEASTGPLPPRRALRKVEQTFGSRLTSEMKSFYEQLNGCKIVWRTKADVEPAVFGILDILPFERAFGGERHASTVDWDDFVTHGELWDDDLEASAPEDVMALKGKRIFDRHLGRNQVLMQPTRDDVELFRFVDGGVSKLDTGLERLLEAAFSTVGVEYYPELLVQPRDEAFAAAVKERARVANPALHMP